jgi:hypothetical protein
MADKVGRTKQETTAREWVLGIAGGLLIAVIGVTMRNDSIVVVGGLLAVVGVVGLLWRLTKDR